MDWISCKERLPEQYVDVLIFVKETDRFSSGIFFGWLEENERFTLDSDTPSHILRDRVTHWMPLPDPPPKSD